MSLLYFSKSALACLLIVASSVVEYFHNTQNVFFSFSAALNLLCMFAVTESIKTKKTCVLNSLSGPRFGDCVEVEDLSATLRLTSRSVSLLNVALVPIFSTTALHSA